MTDEHLPDDADSLAESAEELQKRADLFQRLFEQNIRKSGIPEQVDASHRRSGLALLAALGAVLGMVLGGVALWLAYDAGSEARKDDRLASVARAYANCEGGNRTLEKVDLGYSVLAQLSYAAQTTPEGVARIRRAHEALRTGLNRNDCAGLLGGLSPAEAASVRAEATRTLPVLPLPPPPTPVTTP